MPPKRSPIAPVDSSRPQKKLKQETITILDDDDAVVVEEQKQPQELQDPDYLLALSLQPRECTICLEERDADFFHTLPQCQHSFCRDCLGEHLGTLINDRGAAVLCPHVNCGAEIGVAEMELLIDATQVEKYSEGSLQSFVEKNSDAYACCPTPDCQYLFFFEAGEHDFQCPQCRRRYCLKCRVDWHRDSTCEQYQAWSLLNGQSDDLFGELAAGQKMKQCARCRNFIQKAQGCDHMTCRCGHQFCYRCGQKWPHAKCPADATVVAVVQPRPQPRRPVAVVVPHHRKQRKR